MVSNLLSIYLSIYQVSVRRLPSTGGDDDDAAHESGGPPLSDITLTLTLTPNPNPNRNPNQVGHRSAIGRSGRPRRGSWGATWRTCSDFRIGCVAPTVRPQAGPSLTQNGHGHGADQLTHRHKYFTSCVLHKNVPSHMAKAAAQPRPRPHPNQRSSGLTPIAAAQPRP